MRRKGVPCGCTDNGGCCGLKEKLAILWDRTIGSILKINDQTPDGDGKFEIRAGDNIEVSDISNGIEIGMKNPLTDDVTIQADLTVDGDIVANGDIIQNGSAYETHAEKIYTNDDYIVMREGAVGPLGAGDFSGFQVTKYDGTNDGRLVVDRDGTARVGDVGDEQPLATRDESADLTDEHLLKWDATNLKLVDAGVSVDDVGGMELVEDERIMLITPATPNDTETVNIALSNNMKFEAGYDYYLQILNADPSVMANLEPTEFVIENNHTWGLKYQASGQFQLRWRFYRMKTNTPLGGGNVRINAMVTPSVMLQEKLVSGTNIKTVGGQSILGSGDIPAGGLTWTERANNNDWSDLFEVDDTKVTAKKNILLYNVINPSFPPIFINKGLYRSGNTGIIINYPTFGGTGSTFFTSASLRISYDRISSGTTFQIELHKVTLTTDGTTVTATVGSQFSTLQKYEIKVWTAD